MQKRAVLASLAFCLWAHALNAAELEVVGTGDGMELLQSIAAAYNRSQSKHVVLVPPSIGSGGAVTAVGAGRTSLGRIARPLSERERAQGLIEVPIMRIPSAIYVHPSAGVTELKSDQLISIYSGAVHNWKEVGGRDERIRVVRREEADSTLSVLRATMPGWRNVQITKRSKLAMTTQEAIETVKDVHGTIGFGPYSTDLEKTSSVLRVDGRHPLDKAYPSAVTLSLLLKEDNVTPAAREFIDFARSSAAREMMQKWGGVPIP